MKIKLESDHDLPMDKILSISVMVITGTIVKESNECYPQVFLHECAYK